MTVEQLRGWRKFAVTMVGLLAGFVLGLLGKLSAEFATIVAITVTAYNATNAWAKQYSPDQAQPADHVASPGMVGFTVVDPDEDEARRR